MEELKMKLNIKAMSLTMGIILGLSIFLLTWWVILFDGSSTDPNMISILYRGYSFSPFGSIIGLLWGFADGAIGGACIAWIYNTFASKNKN